MENLKEILYNNAKINSCEHIIKTYPFLEKTILEAMNQALRIHVISQQSELLEAYQHFIDWNEEHDRKASTSERIEAFIASNCG